MKPQGFSITGTKATISSPVKSTTKEPPAKPATGAANSGKSKPQVAKQ